MTVIVEANVLLSSETVKLAGAEMVTEEPVKFIHWLPNAIEVGFVESVGTAALVVKLQVVVQPVAEPPEFFGTTFQ